MTWYEVPVQMWLEAPDEATAVETVMDKMHGGVMAHAGPAEEMPPERMQALFDLEALLDQAAKDSREGVMVQVDGFPGAKFTPQAAAQLAALKFEDEDQ